MLRAMVSSLGVHVSNTIPTLPPSPSTRAVLDFKKSPGIE